MPYSFRLKEYGNGTLQLTYYHNAIWTKDDLWTPYNRPDREANSYVSDFEEWLDCDFINLIPMDLDLEKDATQLTSEDEYMILTEQELQDKKDRSLQSSLNRSKRMIYDYGRSNVWEWFITFTFARVDAFTAENFCECSEKVRKWFKNVRQRYCPDIRYLIVPEQHEDGAWHFHAMVSNCDELTFDIAVNNQRYRKDKKTKEILLNEKGQPIPNKYFGQYLRTSYPDGDFIYNIRQYKNGFTTATKITDTQKTVSYVVKYITKELCECTFGKRRYLPSMNLELPSVKYITGMADRLDELISRIEYHYGVKLSIEHIKSYDIDVENYHNTRSIFEFDVSQKEDAATAAPEDPGE